MTTLKEGDKAPDFKAEDQDGNVIQLSDYKVKLINNKPQLHLLSHRKLFIKFWEIKSSNLIKDSIAIKNLDNYPFPIVLSRFIKSYF